MNNITALTLTLLMAGPASAAALTEPTNRVINLHEMEIKAGKNGQYDEVARDNIIRSLAEQPGTLAMYSLKRKENAHQAYMIEIYASEDAYQQHLSSEPYRSFITRAPDLIGQKKSTVLEPQFLGDKPFVQNKETINNLVIVDVKPADQQAFRDIVLPEMAESLKVGPISPGLVRFTADPLFLNLWQRPALQPRDRSLVTVSALIASGQSAQISYHLNRAMDNGLTAEEAGEIITQAAFYAGWPNAFSAVPVVGEVLRDRAAKQE
ncbi:4-carboxymuconolactone decarboxylase [Pantoea agglomerans]|uniref:carboxymuconolactone decarboxylase family protein n=1 Tax=Enterobacter agglomerans TaxID=549 RepID=UPI000DFD563C|nr:carboxymuconolactone decarboxylase family protein [Pantoea agglomerans]SUB20277.1 4-carboxymuconolactone decarboxylase [Pantoea agglomerans]